VIDLIGNSSGHDWGPWERTEWAEDDESIHPFQRGTYWQKRTCKKCLKYMTEHGPLSGFGLMGSALVGPCVEIGK
jgi:hypothetical protein